jgi:hypothetical protein
MPRQALGNARKTVHASYELWKSIEKVDASWSFICPAASLSSAGCGVTGGDAPPERAPHDTGPDRDDARDRRRGRDMRRLSGRRVARVAEVKRHAAGSDRRRPQHAVLVAALTMTATWVDGGYLLGTAEGIYKSSIQLGVQEASLSASA